MAKTKKTTAAAAEAEVETMPEPAEVEADASAAENHETAQRRVYVGVTLPGARANTVFDGKLPEILSRPYISELVVPLDKLTEIKKNLAVTTSRAALCYRKSAALAAKMKK